MIKSKKTYFIAPLLWLLSSCAMGPDYVRPNTNMPEAYKESRDWKPVKPENTLIRRTWWEDFCDPVLNDLESQIEISNQNIKAAEAQYRQARALTDASRSSFFPLITASASVDRRGNGGQSRSITGNTNSSGVRNSYSASLDASWEPDVWGRIRRTVEANKASEEASAADLQAVRLLAQTELAEDYIQLRIIDAQKRLYDNTVAEYERSYRLTQNQYNVGVAARADVVQAEAQWQSTRAQAIDLDIQRAQLEHAIAILIGKAPADFSIVPVASLPPLPEVPAGIPSEILQRRPDVVAAERRVQSANAQIGVAKAAFFPDLTLNASGGYTSSALAKWFSVPNRVWSVGPELAATLFDAGLRSAQTREAIAAYDQTVAAYRQTVLGGFQEVEDNLVALRVLEQEAQVQEAAIAAARASLRIATNQYQAGIVSYLNVVTAQATALASERAQLDIMNRRLIASIALIKALGGGWDATSTIEAPEK